MNLRISCLLTLVLPLVLSTAAPAVIIDSGDGTGNTSAPSPDPGFDNVGVCNGLTCVYVGGGWILTANHVGGGDATFGGVVYPWKPGSAVRLHNPDNSDADLLLFEVNPPFPLLIQLTIASVPASSNSAHPLYLIGNGRNRGAATSWNGFGGYFWGPGTAMRWGTNFVEAASHLESFFNTYVFETQFDHTGPGHSTSEAQGASGDSGGAVYAWNGSSYELAGTMIGIGTYVDQPPETALYTNVTFAADLSVYHDEIAATMPEPRGGLLAGAALLAWLSAGTRRACRGTGCAASSIPRA
ncbi:MAG TPA: hypothetical protein VKH41_00165 [Myxococcota bacterium]|nr:hypothetical protein [Myxococcota bacterium]